jgi:signal transduction histidine kinase
MIGSMTTPRERIGPLDIAITVVMSALGMLLMYANVHDDNAGVLAYPVFLLVTVPLLWRSVAPVQATAAALGGLVIHDVLFGTDVVRCGVVLPTTFFLVFSSGARLEKREARIGLGVGLGLILAESITFFGGFGVVFAAITAAIWATGRVVHSRGEMVTELQARTVELREARDERARMEVAADRAQLSSDLDELLQRRLGELTSLAAEGSEQRDGGAATATLAEIEKKSRDTLDQMREIVGALRDDTSEAPTAPQPTLTHLEALLVRAKGPGARLSVDGPVRALPPGVELSAYRIVEQLLDALDDAPGVEVHLHFRDDALEIEVSGPARRRAKQAIARARERVDLHRGTLDARTGSGQAEAVVSLPLLAGI